MSAVTTTRPASGEYPPYTINYISLVPDGDIVETLTKQLDESLSLIRGISESRGDFRYEEGKWSIKEVVGHIIDCERIFAYRALRFARGDDTPLAGFEQDDYVRNGGFDKRSLSDLADEYELVRRSTIALFSNLDDEAWLRLGTSNDNPASVRALAFMIAGHERHHLAILRTRYL